MSQLVDKLADLTALRDRDALDLALVGTINDLLQPHTVAICRLVGDAGNEHWFTSAQRAAGELSPSADPIWSSLDLLPKQSDRPLRQQATASGQPVRSKDGPNVTVFPLAGRGECVGVLELGTAAPLSDEAQRLVSGVLRLYLNFQGLLDYGERDTLTELLNRKTFDGAFMKATVEQGLVSVTAQDDRRHTAAAGSYWLAMIDIDHFKRVNDNYGHLIGDEVLLLLARLMRANFRFHDQLYRFGGEEFLVLMHCRGETEADAALARLRVATEAHPFPQVGHITISIGFSEIRTGDTPSAAFERADKALYQAKSGGRNQVCSYAALVASGALVEQAAKVGDMELF